MKPPWETTVTLSSDLWYFASSSKKGELDQKLFWCWPKDFSSLRRSLQVPASISWLDCSSVIPNIWLHFPCPYGGLCSVGRPISLSHSVCRQLKKVCFSWVLNLCFGVIQLIQMPHPSLKSFLFSANYLLFLQHMLCRIVKYSILKLSTTLVFKSMNLN